MKKISSQFKTYASNATIINNNNIETIMLRVVVCSFGLLALLYILFLGNMVSNIVARKNLEANARILANEVGNLELSYLSISNTVDLNLSYAMGFKETKANFTTRKSLSLLPLSKSGGNINIVQNDI